MNNVLVPRLVNLSDINVSEDANPNKMDADTYRSLVHVISTTGSVQPILCWKDQQGQVNLIDGVHRLRAHAELDIPTIYAVVLDDCSKAKAKALRIALNKLRGSLDLNVVQQHIQDLVHLDNWSMDDALLTGFGAGDIREMLQALPEVTLDASVSDPEPTQAEVTDEEGAWEVIIDGFSSKSAFVKARTKLKRLSGKGQPLAVGLSLLLAAYEDKAKVEA